MNGMAYTTRERRNELDGALTFIQGDAAAKAHWMDVSRTGARVRLNRYLVPGRIIRLHFTANQGGHAALEARVQWCERLPGTLEFAAGLAVRRTDTAAALAFASLRETDSAVNGNVKERVRQPRWAAMQATGESENGVAARNAMQHAI